MELSNIFNQILVLSLMGSLLAVFILLIKSIFRQKLSAKLHYCIWLLLILRLVIPFNVQSHLSLSNFIPAENNKFDISYYVENDSTNISKSLINNISSSNNVTVKSNTETKAAEANKLGFNIDTAALIWAAGISGALLYIICINISLSFKIKKSPRCEEQEIIKVLKETKLRLGLNSKIPLVLNNRFKSPAVYGLIRPKILISEKLLRSLTTEELKYVFFHELTHIKRKDLIKNTILMLIQVIYWFNPIVLYSIYQMKQDCELACDADVLHVLSSEEVRNYGVTIINMLKLISQPSMVFGTLGFASKYSKRRIIMITKFKKSSAAIAILALTLTLMVGCASTVNSISSLSSAASTSKGASDNSNTAQNNSASTSGTDKNTATDTPSNNTASNQTAAGSVTKTSATQNNSEVQLLSNIMKLAQQGKIINSEFPVKTTVIDTVEQKLGKADKTDWVPSAKGSYATFSKYNLVFGFNKGSQIFEARSFDSSLNNITLSMVKKAYGAPQYDVKSNGEEIIGYTAGKEYKILLVFSPVSNGVNDPQLKHYSVLYPAGTVNIMANDPGRQW